MATWDWKHQTDGWLCDKGPHCLKYCLKQNMFKKKHRNTELKQLAKIKRIKVLKTVGLLDECVRGSWALVLYYSASKRRYYQTNGPTQEGDTHFYLRYKRQLEVTKPVTLIDDQNHNKSCGFNTSLCSICV